MRRTRSFRRMGLFMALLACVLLTLAPTIVRAQRAVAPADPLWLALHEVCVAGGLVKVTSNQDGEPTTAVLDDCRYCQLGASLDLPPADHCPAVVVTRHGDFPRLYWQAPQRLHAWRSPAPRGPPSLA